MSSRGPLSHPSDNQKNIPAWGVVAQLFSLIVILSAPCSFSREAIKCPTSSELIVYNPESDKLARVQGEEKGRGLSCLSVCPLQIQSPEECVCRARPHQRRQPFVSSAMPTAGNGHATAATIHCGLSHPRPFPPLTVPAQGKSQCHLPSSGSGAFLFMSVHLGHSPSELIVLFFYRFFVCF